MKMIKDLLNCGFWAIIIVLAFVVIVGIATEIIKNIKVSSKIKDNDICVYINKELYCRLDYDITIKYNAGEL